MMELFLSMHPLPYPRRCSYAHLEFTSRKLFRKSNKPITEGGFPPSDMGVAAKFANSKRTLD
jgi:hypothetical protein